MNWNDRYAADNGNVNAAIKWYDSTQKRADESNPDHHDALAERAKYVSNVAHFEGDHPIASEFKKRRLRHETRAKELRNGVQETLF